MHVVVRYLVISFLANAALAQPPFAQSRDNLRIEKLVIESNSLPPADRERIVRFLQQKTYLQPEIGERIRLTWRDEGYLKAVVDEPRYSFLMQAKGKRTAHVTVKVERGAQHSLGEIHIQKATVFLPTQLRSLFSLPSGDLFNTSKFGEGLEDLRKLYATRGYVNCVAVPVVSIDEPRRTIDLVLIVDEGRQFDFGDLGL